MSAHIKGLCIQVVGFQGLQEGRGKTAFGKLEGAKEGFTDWKGPLEDVRL